MLEHFEIQKNEVPNRIYQDLLLGIMWGDFPSESQLPTESSLAKDYGVSRTIVRSALEQLKMDGYIESRQGSGTVVVGDGDQAEHLIAFPLRLRELEEVYECRLTIEPKIAECVATRLSPEAIQYLRKQLEIIDTALEASIYECSADAGFHIKLAEFSGNNFFESIMNALRPHIIFSMNIVKTMNKSDRKLHVIESLLEHRKVAKSIIDNNPDAAHEAMMLHILNGKNRVLALNRFAEKTG